MSDTIPGVRWSLAMECPLRREDEQSKRVFANAQTYSYYLKRPSSKSQIFEGYCVTSANKANIREFKHLPDY